MADQKITQLPTLATPTADDLLVIVDDPAGATPTTKSVRVDAVLALGPAGPPGPEGPPGQSAGRIFYFAPSDASDLAGYQTLLEAPSAGAEVTIPSTCSDTGDVAIGAFVTEPGVPGNTPWPAGTAFRRIFASVSAGEGRLHVQVLKREASGTEILIRDEASPPFTNTAVALQDWTATLPYPGVEMTESDRLVCKVFAQRVSGPASITVTTYWEGVYGSHIQTTISAGAQGPAGPGVAAGGTPGQILGKASATDYDTEWIDPPAGGGGTVDVLWVGPEAPTDPTIELWYDTDAGGGDSMAALPSTCEGRLTTETGVPVSTADRTAQSTLYFTPYRGNRVSLYSGGAWASVTFAEVSLALSGLTVGRPYDVWLYNNAGTPALELLAWTNDTTRATALALQDGIAVKTGDATRRLVGTIYTTGATTTEDSAAKRYVWNVAQRVPRSMVRTETTTSWSYSTDTYRQANGSGANQLEYVVGLADVAVVASVHAIGMSPGSCTVGIGVDSTTANMAQIKQGGNPAPPGTNIGGITAEYRGVSEVGRHRLVWLERANASPTTWFGVQSADMWAAGLIGTVWG